MDIIYRKYLCQDTEKSEAVKKISYKSTDLYIYMTSRCNADCKFCGFRDNRAEEPSKGSIKLLAEALKREKCLIGDIHITGGEPSININELIDVIESLRSEYKDSRINVNTNGIHLKELVELDSLNNVALSRHAISDEDNREIFGTSSVPSTLELSQIKNKQKIHLSCNLIKGYIDSAEKVRDYLEFSSKLGIFDIGIVSLMDKNDYCRERYVSFGQIKQDLNKFNIVNTRNRRDFNPDTNTEYCRCSNYLYQARNYMLISLYHRHAVNSSGIATYLVYNYKTGELRQGFSGKTLCLIGGRSK